MKNLLLIALLYTLGVTTASAQVKNIEYSAPFDEPAAGWRKVLQLSNGNTFLMHYEGKKGLDIYVYDKNRKLISEKNTEGTEWYPKELKVTKIAGCYEIDGSPTLFIQQVIKRVPRLVRIILDANTGTVKSEQLISTLQKHHAGMVYAMVWGGVEEPAFHVEKSPSSDNYVVINFNSISPESDERIQVAYYGVQNGQHKILNKAFYDNQGYKYVNYVASFINDKAAYITAYGFNKAKGDISDARLIISRLNKGSNEFTHKKIEFSDDFEDTRGIMTYNEGSGMLQLLSLTYVKKTSSMWKGQRTIYLPLFTLIDPSSLQIIKATPIKNEYVKTRIEVRFKDKDPFGGMPQYMAVNKDNTTTIIQEEISKLKQAEGKQLTIESRMGNIGVTEYDMRGEEVMGYAAKKSQVAYGDISVFNLTDRVNGKWTYQRPASMIGDNTAFFSFNYINTEKGKYLIYNDLLENYFKEDHEKIETVKSASDMVSVYYELQNGFFKKHYLFEAPKEKNQLKFANIESTDFRDDTNTYAVLMVDRDGRKKQAHIAWIKFE